jgi:magnesium chelatase family protein
MTTTSHGPQAARVFTVAVTGVEGHLTEIHASVSEGPPGLHITGLPEHMVTQTRDRVRAAVVNSGLAWPERRATVTLLPASMPRRGGGFDLAIAIAILTAFGAVPSVPDGCVFVAELGLDGGLRPVRGVLPGLLAAARAGHTHAVVAAGNADEAALASGVSFVACDSLRAVAAWLAGRSFTPAPRPAGENRAAAGGSPFTITTSLPAIPAHVRMALEASAAGGHHLCITTGPGAGTPALAGGLAAILPNLPPGEAIEVAAIHSVAGLLTAGAALPVRPPLRSPHHTITPAAMTGGGSGTIRPGEATLAHHGVLVLEDAPEYTRAVLEVLRQPLREGEITVRRSGTVVRFPAKFTLAASMGACPCGGWPACECLPVAVRRYRTRLTSVLGEHIPIWIGPRGPSPGELGGSEVAPWAASAERVAEARERARRRLDGTPWQVNTEIPGAEMRRAYLPTAEAFAPISRAVDLGEISHRTAFDVLRVAWTLADLARTSRPGAAECGQALAFRMGVAR